MRRQRAPDARREASVGEEGEALFVQPLGFLLGPRTAAGRDAVVVAASGGCNDERGPLVGGAHDPGSFVVLAKLDNEGTKIWTKTFVARRAGPKRRTARRTRSRASGLIGMATSIWPAT